MLFAIDWTGMTGFIVAVTTAVALVLNFLKGVLDKRKLESVDDAQQVEIDDIKESNMIRGLAGAELAMIVEKNALGRIVISEKWRDRLVPLFAEKKNDLKAIRAFLKVKLRREPFFLEVAFEIEKRHKHWLAENVCKEIGRTGYECVAAAYAIACENGSKDHQPDSWKPSPITNT